MRTLARSIWSKLVRSNRAEDAPRPDASTLSGLAGSANALVRTKEVRTRRGTFLVLVVGTLALLSVIAIVYVTIGSQDTRVQAAAAKREKVEDVPQRVADYLADVIARDRVATYYDDSSIRPAGMPQNGLPVLMREISDYPSTDLQVRSSDVSSSASADFLHASWRFDPSGRIDTEYWTAVNPAQIRTSMPPSDPWLATSEPTWIGVDPTDPQQLADPTDVTRLYRDMKDWGHISNFAPNGRFVNLSNLRDNFGAPPGTTPGQMSSNLGLFDANGNSTNQTHFNESADPDVPALWDTNQRGAARPAAFVPYGAAATLPTEDPSDNRFKLYQWADADGDGVLDSRWFELIDDRNGFTNHLGDTGRYRYFIAARAVDLSARVNVNVATDFRSAARLDAPAGVTPGDVDLFRLLSLNDSFDFNAPTSGNESLGGGYDSFRNPTDQALANNYGPGGAPSHANQLVYPPANLGPGYARNRALAVAEFAYASLRLSVASGVPFGPTSLDNTVSFQGVDLLDNTVANDLNIAPRLWDTSDPELGAGRRRQMYQRVASGASGVYDDPTVAGWRTNVRFAMPDLAELLTRNTANDPDTLSTLELVLGGRDDTTNAPGPGSARYSPLRDNRDLKLELAAIPDAAYDVQNAFDSNGAASVSTPLEAFEARYLMQMQTDVRQRLTTMSGSVPLRPLRGVQTGSLSVFELPTDIGAILDPEYNLIDTLTQVQPPTSTPFEQVLPAIKVDSSESNSIFRAYADQLLPFSGTTVNGVNAWDLGSRVAGEMQTAAYGYRGPEVALYAAAHMTANFVDMADTERVTKVNNDPGTPQTYDDDYDANIPSVYTLMVRYDPSDPLGTQRQASMPALDADERYIGDRFAFAASGDAHELNLNFASPSAESPSGRLPEIGNTSAKTVTPVNQVGVNIFGIEAQPFLTRVSTFTTYIDQDTARGAQVIIDGSISSTNRDFAFRVVAWQLTNPFDVPVVLWDNTTEGTTDRQSELPKSRHFIEMDGRTYLIRPLNDSGAVYNEATPPATPPVPDSDQSIVIYPHRTIVLYALSEAPSAIATRVDTTFTAAEVRRAVQNTMGEITPNDPGDSGFNANPQLYSPDRTKFQAMYYIGAVNPASTNPLAEVVPGPATFSSLITTDRPESRLWRHVRTVSRGFGAPAPVQFDQLLDRLRVPDGDPGVAVDPDVYPVLNRRLGDPTTDTTGGANTPIADSAVGPLPGDPDPGFNKAVLTLWATVRRPANPGEPLSGTLPAYCLEPKGSSRWNVFNNDRIDIGSGSWDPVTGTMPRSTWTLDATMFRDNPSTRTGTDANGAYRKFSDWRTSVLDQRFVYRPDQTSTNSAPANEDDSPTMLNIVPNIWGTTGVNPELRTLVGNSERATPGNSFSNANRYNPLLPQTRYYNQWYPQVALNNSYFMTPNVPSAGNPLAFTRSIRTADMLMPLAVGPMMNPAFASNDNNLSGAGSTQLLSTRPWTNMELRWTTLGESMAIALGYQPTLAADGSDTLSKVDIASLANPFSVDVTGADRGNYVKRALFDRGQLRLDEFVLFRDLDDNGLFDYASSGGAAGTADIRLFTEMPAALGILDAFTVKPLVAGSVPGGLGLSLSGASKERDAADLTRPIQGLININTAPPTVLRTIPGLAPWEDFAQRNEIQRIVFNPANAIPSGTAPANGTLKLAIGAAQAISSIEVSAAVAGGLQAHIESIASVGPGNVKVSLVTMNPPTFDVEFVGTLAATDVADLSVVARTGQGTITPSTFQAAILPTIGPKWANGSVLNHEVDLAAVIAATRDKTRQFLRPQSSVSDFTVTQQGLTPAAVLADLDPTASAGFAVEQLSFFDREPGATGVLAGRDLFWPAGFNTPAQIDAWLTNREGRHAITEIRGISEREGFTTVGSVQAAASVRDGSPLTDRFTGLNAAGQVSDFGALPISIDSMGYKTTLTTAGVVDANNHDMLYGQFLRARQDTSQLGLSSSFFQTTWVNNGDRNNRNRVAPDAIPGDYMEKLTPLAAMSNIATTRSDYYAVWFVLHGYTAEDVTVNPTDPLVPSIARRFLMIVDRSNVTSEGQRPKVVLFRELPYTP